MAAFNAGGLLNLAGTLLSSIFIISLSLSMSIKTQWRANTIKKSFG